MVILNLVWPALYVLGSLVALVPVSVGLLVETLALALVVRIPAIKAIGLAIAMNFVSASLGSIALIVLSLLWEAALEIVVHRLFHVATSDWPSWIATFLIAVSVNAEIEYAIVAFFREQAATRRTRHVLWAANSVTVALAYLSLWLNPPWLI